VTSTFRGAASDRWLLS